MKNNFLRSCALWVMAALPAGMMTSCNNDDDIQAPTSLQAPEIVQMEEIISSPLTLAFSWIAVDYATEYSYQLRKTDDQQLITQGTTEELSVWLVYSKEIDLMYETQYTFTLQALTDKLQSEEVSATVTTSEAAISLSIEDLTYRSATLIGKPKDANMLYQFAQIAIEKYTAYDSDTEFIETYDYGYYQELSKMTFGGYEWYQIMAGLSKQGDYTFSTKILSPEKEYLLYAYGVEFDYNSTTDPVHIITPLFKLPFTTPAWEATSNCTFDVEVLSQDMIEIDGVKYVNPTIKITPSDNNEIYYLAIATENVLSLYDDIYHFVFSSILSDELYNGVTDWTNTSFALSGEQTITSYQLQRVATPGVSNAVFVCGISQNGLVTTEIKRIDFTAITESETTQVEKKAGIQLDAMEKLRENISTNPVER